MTKEGLKQHLNMNDYYKFLESKRQLSGEYGFDPLYIPDQAFDFQRHLIEWACRKGRAAIFADCGLGKSLMQLAWAENIVRKTNGNVLILTPLAVSHQTVKEAEKFGIECKKSNDGKPKSKIFVTNYQKLHYFDPKDFEGVVCDESSILKNFDGKIKSQVTEFLRSMKYRLLCTATAAPNDFIELGTSSEALGHMGFMDMIGRFFKKSGSTTSRKDETRAGTFHLKDHAKKDFWRWVVSWSRAIRNPSDLGFSSFGHTLPELVTRQHVVSCRNKNPEFLFDMPAVGLQEQRAERSRSVEERCDMAAGIINNQNESAIAWCYLNKESEQLNKLINDSKEVKGSDDDDYKEECFQAFESGQIKCLITKPTIAGFGLNWQHCNRMTFFPSHSFEQWYQSIRRCWRFGQKNKVIVDVISSEGEADVLKNLQRKAAQAETMFANMVNLMQNELEIKTEDTHNTKTLIPAWL